MTKTPTSRSRLFTPRRLVLAVVVVAGLAVGFHLGSPQTIGGSPTDQTKAREAGSSGLDPTPGPPEVDLAAVTVDAAALPDGWRELPVAPPKGAPLCPVEEAAAIAPTATASVSFTDPSQSKVRAEKVSTYAPGDAERVLEAIANKAPSCMTFRADGAVYALTELTAPALGDEAVAFQVMSDAMGPNGPERMFADVVYVRSGDLVVTMSHLSANTSDVAGTEDFVRACLTKAGIVIP